MDSVHGVARSSAAGCASARQQGNDNSLYECLDIGVIEVVVVEQSPEIQRPDEHVSDEIGI